MAKDPTQETQKDAESAEAEAEGSAERTPEEEAASRREFFKKLTEVKESITEGVITCW